MQFTRISLMMLAVGSLLLPARIATAQRPSDKDVVQMGYRAKARRAARGAANQCGPGSSCLPDGRCDACDGRGCGMGRGDGCGCGGNCCCGNNCQCSHGGSCGCGRCGGCGDGCNGCGGYGCLSSFLCRINPYHRCTFPPDHGWAPPAQRPIWPTSASYRRYFPSSWTGEQVAIDPNFRHPMIYMPTDTTQLGYYYQHTPYWRARRNMIPPVPHPAEWHTPDYGVVFTGWEDQHGYGSPACPAGTIIHNGGSSIPGNSDGPSVEAVPMMESNPGAPAAPAESKVAPPPPVDPAPAPPAETNAGKSAAVPELFPVPRQ